MDFTKYSAIELTDLAKKAAEAYYTGNPIMSDDEFDALSIHLSNIITGWGYRPDDDSKISHGLLNDLGSLNKIKFPTPVSGTYILTPKFDGITGCVEMNGIHVVSATTRGDGWFGVDVTSKAHVIISRYAINPTAFPSATKIKGEFVCSKKNFDKVKDRYSHPRNFVAGVMNSGSKGDSTIDKETLDLLQLIDFVPYSLLKYTHDKDTFKKSDILIWLSISGFPSFTSDLGEGDPEFLKSYFDKVSDVFPIDGIVLTKEDLIPPVGDDYSGSEQSVAYKFESESIETVLTSVEWNVGTTGKLAPVAVFKTVALSGANISRASVFNFGYIKRNQLAVGSRIIVTRSNEVIPYVKEVVDQKLEWVDVCPEVCPSCGSKLKYDEIDIYCTNKFCGPVVFNKLYRFLEVCGIPQGFSFTNITKFISIMELGSVLDAIELNKWAFSKCDYSSMGDHYSALAGTMRKNIIQKINGGFLPHEFWYMLGINGLGDTTSRKLNKFDPSKSLKDQIEECKGIPVNVTSNLLENEAEVVAVAANIRRLDKIVEEPTNKLKVCVTGKLNIGTRKKFFDLYGDRIEEAAVNKCNVLVVNSTSDSSSYVYAREHNVMIMTEDEFKTYIDSRA